MDENNSQDFMDDTIRICYLIGVKPTRAKQFTGVYKSIREQYINCLVVDKGFRYYLN